MKRNTFICEQLIFKRMCFTEYFGDQMQSDCCFSLPVFVFLFNFLAMSVERDVDDLVQLVPVDISPDVIDPTVETVNLAFNEISTLLERQVIPF